MFCKERTQNWVTSTVGWVAFCLSPVVLQDPHQQWAVGMLAFQNSLCLSEHLIYAVLPQIQSEENVQLCKTPGFCLAPKLLSAAEFRFSHLTLHCLFFHSPGVEES